MRTLAATALLSLIFPLSPVVARAQDEAAEVTTPPSAAPAETPPPPTAQPPPPPAQRPAQPAQPGGQWVYTDQYGWIWMPYGDTYSWVPPDGYGEPYAYVYYPDYGWTWVVAPWVWGIGPWPFFGVLGPVRFGWYVHGWWHTPWRWHYRPYWGVGGYGGRGYWRGGSRPIAPAPNRPVPGFGRGSVHSFGARSVPRLEIGHGTARAPMHFGR